MKLKNTLLFITLATIMFGQSEINAAAAWSKCPTCPTFWVFLRNADLKKIMEDFHTLTFSCFLPDRVHLERVTELMTRTYHHEYCDDMERDLEAKESNARFQRNSAFLYDNVTPEARLDPFHPSLVRGLMILTRPFIVAGALASSGVFLYNANTYRANSALARDMRFSRDTLEKALLCRIGVFKLSLNRAANFLADNAQRNGASSKDLMSRKLALRATPIKEVLAYADITKEKKIAVDAAFEKIQHKAQHNKYKSLNNMIISGLCLGLCVLVIIYIVQ